jgi:hypothetical protein
VNDNDFIHCIFSSDHLCCVYQMSPGVKPMTANRPSILTMSFFVAFAALLVAAAASPVLNVAAQVIA